jgi:AraC family transcriptional regulator
MNPAQKALWFIESHLADELTLDGIAGVGGISRFHMVRAFAAATGLSVMRYVRARRLSEAARSLANGESLPQNRIGSRPRGAALRSL